MKFTYRWGEKPLDGFTIKRGLGQGGFGEVYFAVSDGGKEVALKLIRGHSDIELRGIANCLNLKHPHLVHLYDLRTDSHGERWLVMEYIQGEPLNSLLNRNPRGLPEAQARTLFLQAARAVAYLHDHAVVHRDIKPGNLFVEDGAVKLGDYGLSKTVGTSQIANSSNVGTIHYMAPEIASGNYSKQIDIYACGVMLYELLTGEVPFKGESWAEIAIKHQTDTPRLERISAGNRAILEKALDKNAARRYRDMNEMIAAVEALQAGPKPANLAETAPYLPPQNRPAVQAAPPGKADPIARTWRGKIGELATAMALAPLPSLASVLVWAVVSNKLEWPVLGEVYLLTVATAWTVLVPAKMWEGKKGVGYRRLRMAMLGAVLGLFAVWLEGWTMPSFAVEAARGTAVREVQFGFPAGSIHESARSLTPERAFIGTIVYFTAMLFLLRWWSYAGRYREDKFSLWIVASVAFAGWCGIRFLQEWDYPVPSNFAIVALATAAGAIQLVSPWSERPPARPKKLRLQGA